MGNRNGEQLGQPATNGNGRKGGRRDREPVALALALGRTAADAARECGVSERSVYNWKADGDFQARVRELRDELFGAAVGRLAALFGKAADELEKLLQARSETVRLGAVRAAFEIAARLREQGELAARLAAVERRLKEQGGGGGASDAAAGAG